MERIGNPDAQLVATRRLEAEDRRSIRADNHHAATESIAAYIHELCGSVPPSAIGSYTAAFTWVCSTADHGEVIAELRRKQPLDVTHLTVARSR